MASFDKSFLYPWEDIVQQIRVKLLRGSDFLPGELSVTNFRIVFSGTDRALVLPIPIFGVQRVETTGTNVVTFFLKGTGILRFMNDGGPHDLTNVIKLLQVQWTSTIAPNLPHPFALMFYNVFARVYGTEDNTGWRVYDPVVELHRMGLPDDRWRLSIVNASYKFCSTYPKILAVPASIRDETLERAARFRSRSRIPVLSWVHPTTRAVICRSSQPMTGPLLAREEADESLLGAILEMSPGAKTLYIIDARPHLNAVANQAAGAGTEVIGNYRNAKLVFMNIANIHVLRDSHEKLVEECYNDSGSGSWLTRLESTGWLSHVRTLLSAGMQIVSLMDREQVSVLVHCSDGWDRTPQLTGLAMLMLDPYYRTFSGFMVLIEKEWVSYGHKFEHRAGHTEAITVGETGKKQGDASSDRSPIFLLWLDCIFQIMRQYPRSFEFNEALLSLVADHVYSCQFGTFLGNSHQARELIEAYADTISIWSFVNKTKSAYKNPHYRAFDGVLYPSCAQKRIVFWENYHLRYDADAVPRETIDEHVIEMLHELRFKEAAIARLSNQQPQSQNSPSLSAITDSPASLPPSSAKFSRSEAPPFSGAPFYHPLQSEAGEANPLALSESDESEEEKPTPVKRTPSKQLLITPEPLSPDIPTDKPKRLETDDSFEKVTPATAAVPCWVPDAHATGCSKCRHSFTTFSRKHHCRMCGRVFCQSCSSHRIPLPQLGFTSRQRVCDWCVSGQ